MSRSSSLPSPTFSPLYRQIKELILRHLESGEWGPGDHIPSESELAARFGVSQGTVRKAIDEIIRVLKPGGSLFLEEPRGVDIKVFDAFFRWGHPNTDFGLNALDAHLTQHGLTIETKQWTPLLTMYHIKK